MRCVCMIYLLYTDVYIYFTFVTFVWYTYYMPIVYLLIYEHAYIHTDTWNACVVCRDTVQSPTEFTRYVYIIYPLYTYVCMNLHTYIFTRERRAQSAGTPYRAQLRGTFILYTYYTPTYIYVYIYIYIYVHIYMYICLQIYTHTHEYIHINIY